MSCCRYLVLISFCGSLACAESSLRQSKPTNEGEGVEGYIQSQSVPEGETVVISSGTAKVTISEGTFAEEVIVGIRHLSNPSIDSITLELGEVEAPPVEVKIVRAADLQVVAASEFALPIRVQQELADVEETNHLKAVVVANPGTEEETAELYPNKLIEISQENALKLVGQPATASIETYEPFATVAFFESSATATKIVLTTAVSKKSVDGSSAGGSNTGDSNTAVTNIHLVWSKSAVKNASEFSLDYKYARHTNNQWTSEIIAQRELTPGTVHRRRENDAAFWSGQYPFVVWADGTTNLMGSARDAVGAWQTIPIQPYSNAAGTYYTEEGKISVFSQRDSEEKFELLSIDHQFNQGISVGQAVDAPMQQGSLLNSKSVAYPGTPIAHTDAFFVWQPANSSFDKLTFPNSCADDSKPKSLRAKVLGTSLHTAIRCKTPNPALTYYADFKYRGEAVSSGIAIAPLSSLQEYAFAINNKGGALVAIFGLDSENAASLDIYRKPNDEAKFYQVKSLSHAGTSDACSFRGVTIALDDDENYHLAFEEVDSTARLANLIYATDASGQYESLILDQVTTDGCNSSDGVETGFWIGGLHIDGTPGRGVTF